MKKNLCSLFSSNSILNKSFLCLTIAALFIASIHGFNAYAQNGAVVIKGKVVNEQGVPMQNVSVEEKGGKGTTTKDDGTFSLNVKSNSSILLISYTGYENIELPAKMASMVTMKQGTNDLTELVVTALGVKRQAKSIGYTVQKVSSSELTKAAAPNLSSGLIGKAAGLNVSLANGVQGGSSRVIIRGNNSILGNNQALIVIDGVVMENNPLGGISSTVGAAAIATTQDWGSFMNMINSDDLEDVTVLKGANASSLYGARGANGVILITTKRGSATKKGLGIDYNVSTIGTHIYRFQDVQNEYGYGGASSMWTANQTFAKDANGNLRYPGEAPWSGGITDGKYLQQGDIPGGYSSWEHFSWYANAASWGPKLDGTEIVWWDGVKRKWDPQPDNRKAFFRNGNTTTHNLSINNSGDWGTARLSFTRIDNKAVMPNIDYNQNTLNLGSNFNISKWLKSEISVNFTNYNRHNTINVGDNNSWTKIILYSMSRDYKPSIEQNTYRNDDGSKNKWNGPGYIFYPYGSYTNSLWWNTYMNNTDLSRNQLIGSVKLLSEVTPWLNITGRVSLVNAVTLIETKNQPTDVGGVTDGSYVVEHIRNNDFNMEAFATFHKNGIAKKINANLMLGASSTRSRMYDDQQKNAGPFTVPFKFFLTNYTDINKALSITEKWNDFNINSLMAIADISYDNYLFLQLSTRNDWSSTLPVETSSYAYPAASLSFVFTDAFSLKNKWLSYGKLKTSLSQSANGATPYSTRLGYEVNSFGGQGTRSIPTKLPPYTLLKPQRTNSFEIGIDMSFLDNKLGVDFTYYKSRSFDQILDGSISNASGSNSITFNTGELSNKGFEFIVRATPVQNKNFRWNLTFNGAHNQNKVLSLFPGIEKYNIGNLFDGAIYGVDMAVKVGDDYGTIYGFDYKYLNGQKVVKQVIGKSSSGAYANKVVGTRYETTSDAVAIGNATPKLTGGFSNTLRYKDFSLYCLIDFKLGGDIYSADYAAAMGTGIAPETLKERNGGGLDFTYPDGSTAKHGVILEGVIDDGTPTGKKNTDVVHYMYKYAGVYQAWSSEKMPRSTAIFENSWAKMREFTLTYSVPANMLKHVKFVQGLDVSLIGRDLFYFYTTLPDHLNPEAISGVGNAQGIQWAGMPGGRSFGVSAKFKF